MGQSMTIGGIDCWFHIGADGSDGGIQENYSLESGPEARCTFKCAWTDRTYLIQELLGTVDYENGTVARTPPFSYPLDQRILNDTSNLLIGDRWLCTGIGSVR